MWVMLSMKSQGAVLAIAVSVEISPSRHDTMWPQCIGLSGRSICLAAGMVHHRSIGPTSGATATTAACLGLRPSEFRGLSVSGAGAYCFALGLIRMAVVRAATLNVPARNLQPR